MTIGERTRAIIAQHQGIALDACTDAARFSDDLGADELDRIEIVLAIEEEFDCRIDDADVDGFETVGDVIRFLEARHGPSGAAAVG
jgi:acyl carrier protein